MYLKADKSSIAFKIIYSCRAANGTIAEDIIQKINLFFRVVKTKISDEVRQLPKECRDRGHNLNMNLKVSDGYSESNS